VEGTLNFGEKPKGRIASPGRIDQPFDAFNVAAYVQRQEIWEPKKPWEPKKMWTH
jgi:hypothetical protein